MKKFRIKYLSFNVELKLNDFFLIHLHSEKTLKFIKCH